MKKKKIVFRKRRYGPVLITNWSDYKKFMGDLHNPPAPTEEMVNVAKEVIHWFK
jgi:uncharacterized protein (DUF1778 family)